MPDLQTLARTALTSIASAHPSLVVSVVVDGTTVSCVAANRRAQGNNEAMGYTAEDTQAMYGSAASLGDVRNGEPVTVGGAPAEVVTATNDPATGLTRLEVRFVPAATGVRP